MEDIVVVSLTEVDITLLSETDTCDVENAILTKLGHMENAS